MGQDLGEKPLADRGRWWIWRDGAFGGAQGPRRRRLRIILCLFAAVFIVSWVKQWRGLPAIAGRKSGAEAVHAIVRRQSAWWHGGGALRMHPTSLAAQYDVRIPKHNALEVPHCQSAEIGVNYRLCHGKIEILDHLMRHTRAQSRGRIDETAREAIMPLVGRRILIIGDSIDRLHLENLQKLLPKQSVAVQSYRLLEPDNPIYEKHHGHACRSLVINLDSPDTMAADGKHSFATMYTATTAPLPKQLRIDFLMSFGALDEHARSWLDKIPVDMKPYELSLRLPLAASMWGGNAKDAYSRSRAARYDLIEINVGLWDLAGYQRRNHVDNGNDDSDGLSNSLMHRYRESMAQIVKLIRTTYRPTIPILLRPIHDTRLPSLRWFSKTLAKGTAKEPFSTLRTHQLRRTQVQVAEDLALVINPFALHVEGQDPDNYLFDDIHPNINGSTIYWEMMLTWLALSPK